MCACGAVVGETVGWLVIRSVVAWWGSAVVGVVEWLWGGGVVLVGVFGVVSVMCTVSYVL